MNAVANLHRDGVADYLQYAAESKASATASRSSGKRCPYLSSVKTADLCPRSFGTTLTLAPSLISNEAISRLPEGQVPATTCGWEHQCIVRTACDLRVRQACGELRDGDSAGGVVLGWSFAEVLGDPVGQDVR
jgi:hypothetical protein